MSFIDILTVVDEFIQGGHQFTCWDVTCEVRKRGESVKHSTIRNTVHGLNGDNLPPFRDSDYSRNTTNFVTKDGKSDTAEVYRKTDDWRDYDPDRVSTPNSNSSSDSSDSSVSTDFPPLQATVAPVAPTPAPKVPKRRSDVVLADITYECIYGCGKHCMSELIRNKSGKGSYIVYTDGTNSGQDRASTNTSVKTSSQLGKNFNVDKRGRICVRNDLVRQLGVKFGDRVYLQKNGGKGIIVSTAPSSYGYIGSLKVDRDDNVRISRAKQRKAGITAVQFTMTKDGNKLVLSV